VDSAEAIKAVLDPVVDARPQQRRLAGYRRWHGSGVLYYRDEGLS